MSTLDLVWRARAVTCDASGEMLKTGEKLVYLLLATYINQDNGFAWPTVTRIAKEAGLKRRHTNEIIESLVRRGLVTRTARFSEKGEPIANAYVLAVPDSVGDLLRSTAIPSCAPPQYLLQPTAGPSSAPPQEDMRWSAVPSCAPPQPKEKPKTELNPQPKNEAESSSSAPTAPAMMTTTYDPGEFWFEAIGTRPNPTMRAELVKLAGVHGFDVVCQAIERTAIQDGRSIAYVRKVVESIERESAVVPQEADDRDAIEEFRRRKLEARAG